MLLVGDSLGIVVLGHENTLPVTLEAMIHHTQAVRRGAERALVVADMPFLTCTRSVSPTPVRNAGRLLQEGGAGAVKIEGGRPMIDVVRRLVDVGIPVMGHLGAAATVRASGRRISEAGNAAGRARRNPCRCRRSREKPAHSQSCWKWCRPKWLERSRRAWEYQPSVLAPDPSVTARYSSVTTCWGSSTDSCPRS